jgi:hypothetical protein
VPEDFPAERLLCHDLPVSSNICFKLKTSPSGWVSMAFFATTPVTIPGLVSLTKSRPVHYNGLGYGLTAVVAALIVLRHFRSATVLEADGLRLRYTFSGRYLRWSEITRVEVTERGKVRLAYVWVSPGKKVRLPAPFAGGSFDGSQFDAQVAEITAAWKKAKPEEAAWESSASAPRSGPHRA